MIVLGIETSCDDTAAAIVENGHRIIASTVSGQEDFHRKYGGVVPEIASRMHLELIDLACRSCLDDAGMDLRDVDAVAVTVGPGLMGSLLVGLNFAKALAYAIKKPFFGVDHLEAHMAAPFLGNEKPEYPLAGLVVSGGHTNLYLIRDRINRELLGRTVDDAAGEAFDKVAKFLGLGYPGGVIIDELAGKGNGKAHDFPRPMINSGDFNFSFSGLKTAVINTIEKLGPDRLRGDGLNDLVASFQEAVVDLLVSKTVSAATSLSIERIAVSGGVAANSRLRQALKTVGDKRGWSIIFPKKEHCTDNAAMVAAAGYYHLLKGEVSDLSLDSYAGSPDVPRGKLTVDEKKRALPEKKGEGKN